MDISENNNQHKTKNQTCIVLLTCKKNDETMQVANEMFYSCQRVFDFVVLFDQRVGSIENIKLDLKAPAYKFSIDDLRARYKLLGPPLTADLTPGNTVYSLLEFSQSFSYDYYWLIEDDVRYAGEWFDFFFGFESDPSDLLGTTLRDRESQSKWYWWSSLKKPRFSRLRRSEMIRGFLPVMRVSRNGLDVLKRSNRKGWVGHTEVLLPTLLYKSHMIISDIGGDGPFAPTTRFKQNYINSPMNRNLAPGTFVCPPARPIEGTIPNMLYHPVKK